MILHDELILQSITYLYILSALSRRGLFIPCRAVPQTYGKDWSIPRVEMAVFSVISLTHTTVILPPILYRSLPPIIP